MENGFIKIYRSLLNWEWYQDTNTKVVFLHLLLTVNYEDAKWKGREIRRGQIVTSYQKLAEQINISVQSVRTAIKHLILTGELTNQTTAESSLITVINYDKYQQLTYQSTSDQQATNKPLTSDQQATNNKGIKQETKKANKARIDTSASPIDTSSTHESKERSEKHGYGEFGNVLLSDEEHAKLQEKFPEDWQSRISKLDLYIGSKGAKYKSHYMTILTWARENGDTSTASNALTPSRDKGYFEHVYDTGLIIETGKEGFDAAIGHYRRRQDVEVEVTAPNRFTVRRKAVCGTPTPTQRSP